METSIVKNQYVISLRNGMIAYIIADSLEDIARGLQNNKFFNTKENMMINTADIVAIMSPSEWTDQQKYQRGWYKSHRGTKWYNKKGEYEEETDLGEKYQNADKKLSEVLTSGDKELARDFIEKLRVSQVKEIMMDRRALGIAEAEELAGIYLQTITNK